MTRSRLSRDLAYAESPDDVLLAVVVVVVVVVAEAEIEVEADEAGDDVLILDLQVVEKVPALAKTLTPHVLALQKDRPVSTETDD